MFLLIVVDIQRIDSGDYTCQAISQLTGSLTKWTSRLTVESPLNPNIKFFRMPHITMFPEAPKKPTLVNVTETSITLRWQRSSSSSNININGNIGSSATHLGTTIEAYSPDFPNHSWQPVANRILADIFTVKNLRPNTRYLFYVRAQNIHGLGLPSDVSDEIRTNDHQKSSSTSSSSSNSHDHNTMMSNINIDHQSKRLSVPRMLKPRKRRRKTNAMMAATAESFVAKQSSTITNSSSMLFDLDDYHNQYCSYKTDVDKQNGNRKNIDQIECKRLTLCNETEFFDLFCWII